MGAKQNKELEKSYFYARGEWNQWGNWSDVPSEKCGCDECPKVAAVKEQTTISISIYRARGHSN